MSLINKIAVIGFAVLVISIQFIPVERTNPVMNKTLEIPAPAEIRSILTKSCYDCHSNQTKWPFYSYIAPISWLVTHDVEEGRNELNFSEWQSLSEKQKVKKQEKIIEEVSEDKMPLPVYLLMHSSAELTEGEKDMLKNWLKLNNEQLE